MGKKKKQISKRKIVGDIVNGAALLLLIATSSIASQLVYEYNRYSPFFVSGDSMYPFFNASATRTNLSTGEKENNIDGSWGDYDEAGYSYTCDYGLLDCKDGFINRLERFDIVMSYFDDDYSLAGGALFDDDSHAAKIKRLYGFPGESLYFTDEGKLYIKEKGENEYRYFAQEQLLEQDGHLAETTFNVKYGSEENPVMLGEDEYFLVGDNRRSGRSNDSRYRGPIGRAHNLNPSYPSGSYFLRGKIIALTGKADLTIKYENGKKVAESKLIYSSLLLPWDIKQI